MDRYLTRSVYHRHLVALAQTKSRARGYEGSHERSIGRARRESERGSFEKLICLTKIVLSIHELLYRVSNNPLTGEQKMKILSVIELMDLFGTDEIAEDWFITARWPDGLRCAYCKGDRVAERGNHPTQRFHCLDCMKCYSVKTNSVMHSSKLGYRKWAIAIYMFMTHPKGVSSYQLHRNLGIL